MRHAKPSILQVSTRDIGGGAEKVALELHRAYRSLGHDAQLAVGFRKINDATILTLPHHRMSRRIKGLCWRIHAAMQPYYARSGLARRIARTAHALAEPRSARDRSAGREDFHYPGISNLMNSWSAPPEVIHLHNLHGGYFDLRALPRLCRVASVFLTLHDAWLFSGHCAHALACERWRTGCGACPDLTLYPAIARDATAENWMRKRDILAGCRLRVATPCQWLLDRARSSLLAPAMLESRVIPYGVDLTCFRPGDQAAARAALGIDPDAQVLMFAANGIRNNVWKDFATLRAALARIADRQENQRLLMLAVGESAPDEMIGSARIQFVPFQDDPRIMTRYFQAADIYVHAARADTFPNSILEALACGTPVAATAVGGIPEQIQSARPCDGVSPATAEAAETDGPTGWLVPPHDPVALAAAITWLLDNPDLRRKLGRSAAVTARRRFDLQRQTRDYLSWYHDACSCGPAGSPVKNTVLPPATRDFRDLLSVLATHAGTQT